MQGMDSVNPDIISMILEQLQAIRSQDHESLELEQDDVLRELMAQFGLLGVPTAEAGMSEGADELTVPSQGAMAGGMEGFPMEAMLGGAGVPQGGPSEDDILAMLLGGAA